MHTQTTVIDPTADLVTLINVFTVDPEKQIEPVDALDKSTEEIFLGVPGFISANLHVSLDGTRVVNYAQWASEQHYMDALQRPEVREHVGAAAAIAQAFNPTLARVRSVHHSRGGEA